MNLSNLNKDFHWAFEGKKWPRFWTNLIWIQMFLSHLQCYKKPLSQIPLLKMHVSLIHARKLNLPTHVVAWSSLILVFNHRILQHDNLMSQQEACWILAWSKNSPMCPNIFFLLLSSFFFKNYPRSSCFLEIPKL